MKAKPVKAGAGWEGCPNDEATHVLLNIPGPSGHIALPFTIKGDRRGTPNWTWNGDTEKPTIKPSILTTTSDYRCHTWVNDGMVQFLSDCTHEHKGKTLPLDDVEL